MQSLSPVTFKLLKISLRLGVLASTFSITIGSIGFILKTGSPRANFGITTCVADFKHFESVDRHFVNSNGTEKSYFITYDESDLRIIN